MFCFVFHRLWQVCIQQNYKIRHLLFGIPCPFALWHFELDLSRGFLLFPNPSSKWFSIVYFAIIPTTIHSGQVFIKSIWLQTFFPFHQKLLANHFGKHFPQSLSSSIRTFLFFCIYPTRLHFRWYLVNLFILFWYGGREGYIQLTYSFFKNYKSKEF